LLPERGKTSLLFRVCVAKTVEISNSEYASRLRACVGRTEDNDATEAGEELPTPHVQPRNKMTVHHIGSDGYFDRAETAFVTAI
jgi:hypothetical protein